MKNIFNVVFIFIFTSFIFSCGDAAKKVESNEKRLSTDLVKNNQTIGDKKLSLSQPIVEILESEFDFGNIRQGDKVSHNYKIKNIGNADLLISSAKGSCGCTVPEWPKDPIKAGNEANIKVTFDSKGKKGKQAKRVTLMTNAIPNVKILTIKGNITE
tara:strand:+ start:773 stop:1243 length:471 start_codon:yes stop_codon:yes gene_type:complete